MFHRYVKLMKHEIKQPTYSFMGKMVLSFIQDGGHLFWYRQATRGFLMGLTAALISSPWLQASLAALFRRPE